jgi:inosose dehydratase
MTLNTRRRVLKAIGTSTVAALASRFAPAQRRVSGVYFGAQTNAYPIDPKNFGSVLSALDKLKAIGYEGFETGYRNVMPQFALPADARAKIAATGLTFFGIHIFLQRAMYDTTTLVAPASLYEQVAKGGKSLGALNLVCSGAAAESMDQLNAKIAGLNVAGKFCQALELGFAYHNEEPESGSKLNELDILYTETDPAAVKFLLDVGHLYNVGGDVVAFIRKHHQRIAALHIRDYKDHKQVVLGTGTLPLLDIAHTLEQLHWRGWVECEEERLDGVKHGDEYLRPAFTALKEAFSK